MTNNQNLIQSLKEDLNKVRNEKENIQKDLDAKIIDIQEKVKTITQVKKIGRRYKTQYEELKAQQDKVFWVNVIPPPPDSHWVLESNLIEAYGIHLLFTFSLCIPSQPRTAEPPVTAPWVSGFQVFVYYHTWPKD